MLGNIFVVVVAAVVVADVVAAVAGMVRAVVAAMDGRKRTVSPPPVSSSRNGLLGRSGLSHRIVSPWRDGDGGAGRAGHNDRAAADNGDDAQDAIKGDGRPNLFLSGGLHEFVHGAFVPTWTGPAHVANESTKSAGEEPAAKKQATETLVEAIRTGHNWTAQYRAGGTGKGNVIALPDKMRETAAAEIEPSAQEY